MKAINYDLIGRALIHPVQAAILADLAENGGPMSPKELTERIGGRLATISYHVRLLAGLDCSKQKSPYAMTPLLTLFDTAQRRGAVEHYYALTRHATRS